LCKLRTFVSNGGGLLGVHSVTASFKGNEQWFELIGGRFAGHGPVEQIHYQKCEGGDAAFEDVSDFWVRDELYRHELQPGVQAVYEADFEGEAQPMIWTYAFGTGRVFYACPGHKAAVFQNPVYRQVLMKGVDWACGH
jgi:type 1 glutamine amidotransferase